MSKIKPAQIRPRLDRSRLPPPEAGRGAGDAEGVAALAVGGAGEGRGAGLGTAAGMAAAGLAAGGGEPAVLVVLPQCAHRLIPPAA